MDTLKVTQLLNQIAKTKESKKSNAKKMELEIHYDVQNHTHKKTNFLERWTHFQINIKK